MGSVSALKIPTIDFSKENLKPGTSDWDLACNDVRMALEEYGCFEAVYDNVTSGLQNAIFGVAQDLFNLPVETKRLNAIPDKPYFGYFGDFPHLPLYESLGIFYALAFQKIQSFTNLMWPLPEKETSFSETLNSYARRVADLEKMVKRMAFQSLGVDKYYNSHDESTNYLLRFLKYEAPKTNENIIGLVTHTDKTFISILQQNQVNGLEIQTKLGEWIQVTPAAAAASSFIVIIGDLFHAWSNGRFHSPQHRVMLTGNEIRYTMGLFSYGKLITQTPEELVDEQHPLLFKPFDYIGLINFAFTEEAREAGSILKAYCGV